MPITLTRQQLYDRVWNTPVETLAAELGLSGRGLGKLCARYDIPVPPRGYWAKKTAGRRVSQPKLPELTDPYRQKVHFPGLSGIPKDPSDPKGTHPLVAFEKKPTNAVTVAEDLQLTHPLVLKAQRALNSVKRDSTGRIIPRPGIFYIHTCRQEHERALRIMQALLTALEARAFDVNATAEGVRVTILDEAIGFGLEEETKKVEHAISFTEQKLIDRGLGWQVPKHDLVPAGLLSLVITNVKHVRQRFTEGADRRLEQMMNRFIVALVRAALGLKQQRAEAERRAEEAREAERQRLDEARRHAEIERKWQEEQGKVERLERLAKVWRRNQELRRLVADIESAVGEVAADSELGQWLAWVKDHVEGSDPLQRLSGREGRTLTVYYHGWDHDRTAEEGFREPEHPTWDKERTPFGVELTCRPPNPSSYRSPRKLELAEDLLLPFEWAQESDWLWRVFRVPAVVLNRTLGIPTSRNEPSEQV